MKEENKDKVNEFLEEELKIVDEIIKDETWLEGERRKCHVNEDDPAVIDKVAEIFDEKVDEIIHEAKKRADK